MKSPFISGLLNWRTSALGAGIALCMLSGLVLLGWMLGNTSMMRIMPSSTAMAINTGLMFLITGACLMAGSSEQGCASPVYHYLPFVLVLLPLAILIQHIFGLDFGIDLGAVHGAVADGSGYPGRTARNACLGFLLFACTFIVTRAPVG